MADNKIDKVELGRFKCDKGTDTFRVSFKELGFLRAPAVEVSISKWRQRDSGEVWVEVIDRQRNYFAVKYSIGGGAMDIECLTLPWG